MTAQPTPNQPENPPQTRTERLQAILERTLHRADDIAGFVHEQATAQAEAFRAGNPPEKPVDFTKPFDRIARCIRRTILLIEKLDEPPRAVERHDGNAARRKIIRAIENAIDREATPGETATALHAELLDRLDAPELDEDIAHRDIKEIIAEITDDLGLDPWFVTTPRRRRTPRDVEILAARAAGHRVDEPNAPIFPKHKPRKFLPPTAGPPTPSAKECLALLDHLAKA